MATTLYIAGGSFPLAAQHTAEQVREQLIHVPGNRTFFHLANGGIVQIGFSNSSEPVWAVEETA